MPRKTTTAAKKSSKPKRRTYDFDFKKDAVERANEIGISKAAAELDIPKGTLSNWMKNDELAIIPVNNDRMITSHDFDKAKLSIQKNAKKLSPNIALPSFKTKGGFFGLGSHKVTGSEMNEFVMKLQDHLIKVNERNIEISKQFLEIYNAFEALDKDYINGILASVGLCEKNTEEVRKAQEGIDKAFELLQATINKLQDFKSEMEDIEHLNDIDEIWNTLQGQKKSIADHEKKIKKLTKENNALKKQVTQITEELGQAKNDIDLIKQHLEIGYDEL